MKMPLADWAIFPPEFQLSRGHVDIVASATELPADALAQFLKVLTDAERQQMNRFRMPDRRRESTVARGMLRIILGPLLNKHPQDIEFQIGPFGKPATPGGIHFNVSHTRNRVLIALCASAEIGVDVERIRDMKPMELAGRFFSAPEIEALALCQEERQTEAFFECWTRKEAIIKAIGRGIGFGLDCFSVPIGPLPSPATVKLPEGETWAIHGLPIDAGYAAALATPAPMNVRLWQFQV